VRNAFIPLLFIALAIVVTIVGLAIVQAKQHAKTLEQIARRFRGRLEPGKFFLSRGQVRLRFQGYPALLKFVSHGKHSIHTVFSITWPDPGFRLEIYPQDSLSGFRRLWGMEDIEIGSPQFDQAFYISGNSRASVRDMLSAEVQAATWKMAQIGSAPPMYGTRDIQIRFLGGVLTITKPRLLTNEAHLDEFIRLSAELFEAALRTRTTGIEFVGDVAIDAQEPDAVESQCQICGEPLASDLVYCAACRTPHHRECWEYFGGCSTYACGHKQYVTKTKRRKAS
jgi:RING finger family protein